MPENIKLQFNNQCLGLIDELKQKISVVESALGLIHTTTDKMNDVESVVQDVKFKLTMLEKRLLNLLESLTRHLNYAENRISSIERRLSSIEMKEGLIKEGYSSENFKN